MRPLRQDLAVQRHLVATSGVVEGEAVVVPPHQVGGDGAEADELVAEDHYGARRRPH